MSPFMPPPPPGAGSPFQWGDEGYVEEMLGHTFELDFVFEPFFAEPPSFGSPRR